MIDVWCTNGSSSVVAPTRFLEPPPWNHIPLEGILEEYRRVLGWLRYHRRDGDVSWQCHRLWITTAFPGRVSFQPLLSQMSEIARILRRMSWISSRHNALFKTELVVVMLAE